MTAAELNSPVSVAADAVGNLYLADRGNQRVRKIDSQGVITTVVGTGKAGFSSEIQCPESGAITLRTSSATWPNDWATTGPKANSAPMASTGICRWWPGALAWLSAASPENAR